jgi:hypothetical protein
MKEKLEFARLPILLFITPLIRRLKVEMIYYSVQNSEAI